MLHVGVDHENLPNVASSVNYKAGLEEATGPDYAEITDEQCTEKSSEKLHQEAKSSESTKSNNNYFTLTEKPPQEEHESTSNVVR